MNKFCTGCRHIIWIFFTIALIASCSSNKAVPGNPRQIEENTLNLQERWRRSPVLIQGYLDQSKLLTLSGYVAYVQSDPKGAADRVQVVNAADGALVWETRKGQLWGSGPLAIDTKRVYIMSDFMIYAYDLDDGQLVWKSGGLPDHRGYTLRSDGDKLYAQDWTHQAQCRVYYLNTRTGVGEGSDSLSTDDGFDQLAESPSLKLFINYKTLRVVDKATQQPLWTTTINDLLLSPSWDPIVLTDDVLLMDVPVFALDVRTGQLKWRHEGLYIASNVVISNGYMYALDSRARLVQVDIETGQETGHVQFTPADTQSDEKRYWVATDGQMFFIAFNDSQELIALGP